MATPGEQIERFVKGLEATGLMVARDFNPSDRPLMMRIAEDGDSVAVRIFSWNITPGGRRRPRNERRVQPTRSGNAPLHLPEGPKTLLLGYHEELDVFAAWDETKHANPGASSSLQIPLESLEEAASEGFAAHSRAVREGQEIVFAFRPENAREYLEAAGVLEMLADEDAPVVVGAAEGDVPTDDDLPEEETRRRAILTVSVAIRDARFRTRVLDAYERRCAFCGLNAGLVEAAHVRPVFRAGTDDVTNGVAACPTHHAALDRGYLLINDDYTVELNRERLGAAGATDADVLALESNLLDSLRLPAAVSARPSPANLASHRKMWA